MNVPEISPPTHRFHRWALVSSRRLWSAVFTHAIVCAVVCALTLCFTALPAHAQFSPAPGTGTGLPETVEAIDSARVTTRILYITAHPDDESAGVLTYLARALHAEVALLSITRGEGGQNALGPEQAPQLGLIRTQELLAATRGYGVKLYFTRAKDFGFSKTPEEAQKIWGDQALEDMVRVIRTFRPNIVINNFGGVHGGHGHHQAAGILTPRAVQLAADPSYKLPDSVPVSSAKALFTWGGKEHPVKVLNLDRGSANPKGLILPLDEVSPLWGKTWSEIAIDAFANHRTQGISAFLGSPFLRRQTALVPAKESNPQSTLDASELAAPLYRLGGDSSGKGCAPNAFFCPVLKQVDEALQRAGQQGLALNWREASASLAQAAKHLQSLYPKGSHAAHWTPADPLLEELMAVQRRIDRALALAAGLEIVAEADRSQLVSGEPFTVSIQAGCRKEVGCELGDAKLQMPANFRHEKTEGSSQSHKFTINPGGPAPALSVWEQQQPEPPALVAVDQQATIAGYAFHVARDVTHIEANSTRVARVPLRVVPRYTLEVQPKQQIEVLAQPKKPFDVLLLVHANATSPGRPGIGLDVPAGWASTAPVDVEFNGADGARDRYVRFTVTPPRELRPGTYAVTAYAQQASEKFTTSLQPLPSVPTLLWSAPAVCLVRAFDINVPEKLHVGYISAESEPVPEALEHLGVHVELLDAASLSFGDLSRFDAIVVDVRAYELRPDLPGANQRLLDYVSAGGTLVVQYQRDFAWDKFQYAPYPAKITPAPGSPLPRITDENSPVQFLAPADPLLNRPNKITQDDFSGWVQERGLYFWSQFDPKYTPLLAMNDPGEPALNGSLVYTHFGKGVYIYTALAFVRQLPEGVPGAYRLFINLLSASRLP
ncbi:MAG: PIG-L family deacetylase [Candidatus Acidiferrum sp.]